MWGNARHLFLIFAMLLLSVGHVPAARAAEWFAMRTYSNLSFIPEEGDTVGLSVTIIPYSYGIKTLWRHGGGPLTVEGAFDAVPDGEFLVVEIPPGQGNEGTWKLRETGKVLTVYSPRDVRFRLRRMQSH
jgi:hypothetical protein